MELSWLMKLRITASVATGAILIGILGWPLVAPSEPLGTVSLLAGSISGIEAALLVVLGFLAGLIGYIVSWPYGREIGILAAPSGLAVLSLRCGTMADLLRSTAVSERPALFSALRWEPVFWLAIVAAGFGGVLIGQKIHAKQEPDETQGKSNPGSNIDLNVIIALVCSVLIAQFFISIFARDVKIPDDKLGSVIAQPSTEQIAFAVFVSFGLAAFVVKKFLHVSYIWPTIASAFVTAFVIMTYVKRDVLQYIVQNWPVVFFSNAGVSILPVQMVAFGTLGSISGFWLAVRYSYWRKHA